VKFEIGDIIKKTNIYNENWIIFKIIKFNKNKYENYDCSGRILQNNGYFDTSYNIDEFNFVIYNSGSKIEKITPKQAFLLMI